MQELTNLYFFELDNSIFIYSSKDKDQYRPLKHNNIMAYIILMLILELNESHIGFLNSDQKHLCNFTVFEKYGFVLFEGINIRKNNVWFIS